MDEILKDWDFCFAYLVDILVFSRSPKILTEGFPYFFLSCKANARVKLAKMGHGQHSSKLVVICVVLRIVCV